MHPAAYGPFYQWDRRKAYLALAVLVVAVTRAWQPSVTIITIGLLRTAVRPLLALYFDTRRRLVAALTGRAERAERERACPPSRPTPTNAPGWPPRCTT
ncbi:MAG TPA: hypothetical protein VK280_27625 [Streptosporangiaceae bacterium]|nr:hypothetical protein [Streptosporangiaceae bacterium]